MRIVLAVIVRPALAWGRWAARHRNVARLVYIAMYLSVGVLYGALFGIWAGILATIAVILVVELTMAWARNMRRRRGLPPLPSVWRDPSNK